MEWISLGLQNQKIREMRNLSGSNELLLWEMGPVYLLCTPYKLLLRIISVLEDS